MKPKPPNFLCISIDSLRRDFCSVYNRSETTTPFLNSLANGATVYNNAISPSCWTLQVHTSVFTGKYPPEHKVLDKNQSLGPHPTFAEILDDEGYDCKSFTYNGWFEAGDILRGFEHLPTEALWESWPEKLARRIRQVFRRQVMRDEITVSNMENSITKVEGPFCYFLHLNDVHFPYSPKFPYYRQYMDSSFIGVFMNYLKQRKVYDRREEMYIGDYCPDEGLMKRIKSMYCACIKKTDDLIQDVIETLVKEDVFDNTVIVIFGDHGDNFGEDGIYGHQFSVADSLIRVPLIIRDPTGTLPKGYHDDVVQLNDLYPTLLGISGLEIPKTNSINLGEDGRETAFTYYSTPESFIDSFSIESENENLPPKKQYVAWESPEKKLIYYPQSNEYDGPAAENDRLKQELEEHFSSLDITSKFERTKISDRVEENLRQMGYL